MDFGPPGIDLKAFKPPRLDLELFKAPGLDFAAIWASSAWFGTTCGTSQGSIWNNLSLQRRFSSHVASIWNHLGPPGLDLEPFGALGLDFELF